MNDQQERKIHRIKPANAAEAQRARLRHDLAATPKNQQIRKILRTSLKARYVRQAATDGLFIGYAPSDALLALELALTLKDAGLDVFLDELDIPPDTHWDQPINDALQRCGVLVMILSPESMKNRELQAIRLACMRAGKVVLPVLAAPVPTRHLPENIEPIDCILDQQAGLRQLLRLLIEDEAQFFG